jgi:hypothetical protein
MGFDLKFEQDGAFSGTSKAWLASRMGVDICRGITLALELFNPATHYPNGFIPSGMCLGKVTTGGLIGLYGPYGGLANEVQTVNLGAASAGTVTITFQGSTTAPIAFDATVAQVQAALDALPNIGPGDVTVTGGPWPATDLTLTFSGQYAGVNVSPITVDGAGATGETITIASPTAGGSAGLATLDVLTGHLLDDVKVRTTNGAGRSVGTLYWNGIVVESRLPANSGIDTNGKADVAAHIRYE